MGKTAFVFPGQGAQKIGMCKDFYDHSGKAREVFAKASELLGFSMEDLCFKENDRIDLTEYTQAALVTAGASILAELKERQIVPDTAAGLSLGEYEALIAVNAMRFEDAVCVVRQRGIFMQEAVPEGLGAMAAVIGLSRDTMEEVLYRCRKEREADSCCVVIANDNCPGQLVISGWKKDVEAVMPRLKEAGAKKCTLLNVSGPFHSPLLIPAGERLKNVLAPVTISEHKIPYVTNVTGEPVTGTDEVKDLLCAQVSHPVLFRQSVERMIADGVDTFVEIGPGTTLSSCIRRVSRQVKCLHLETWDELTALVEELAERGDKTADAKSV